MWICANNFTDSYIKEYIRQNGQYHTCDFAKDKNGHKLYRKCIRFKDFVDFIIDCIDYWYPPVEGNIYYDSEEHKYVDEDKFLSIHDVLDEFQDKMGCSDEVEIIIEKSISFDDSRVPRENVFGSLEYENRVDWEDYCNLVNETELRPEQIIYEMDSPDRDDIFDQIKSYIVEALWYNSQFVNTYILNPDKVIYRSVNYLDEGYEDKYKCHRITASMVGTPPSACIINSTNRMSDKGEMVFYGASDKDVCCKEATNAKGKYCVVGKFHTNKRIWLLDLSQLNGYKNPSFFDIAHQEERRMWFFLEQFMENISKTVKEDTDKAYKPTQVFAKFIQRKTKFSGIAYPSSLYGLSEDYAGTVYGKVCYAIFVDNQHCIDEGRKNWDSSLKLIMEPDPEIINEG